MYIVITSQMVIRPTMAHETCKANVPALTIPGIMAEYVIGSGLLGGAFFESCNCNVAVVVMLRSIFCTSFRDHSADRLANQSTTLPGNCSATQSALHKAVLLISSLMHDLEGHRPWCISIGSSLVVCHSIFSTISLA